VVKVSASPKRAGQRRLRRRRSLEYNADGDPTVGGLAGVLVDLRVKAELLSSRPVVGDRSRQDQPIVEELAATLRPSCEHEVERWMSGGVMPKL